MAILVGSHRLIFSCRLTSDVKSALFGIWSSLEFLQDAKCIAQVSQYSFWVTIFIIFKNDNLQQSLYELLSANKARRY